ISEELALLGASLSGSAVLDHSIVTLSALSGKLEPALAILADVTLHPAFPQSELERVRGISLARLRQEKNQPNSMALRVLPRLLYGPAHPYGQPLTGSGTEASIRAISRDELAGFHRQWFRPNRAAIVVAGDVTMSEL